MLTLCNNSVTEPCHPQRASIVTGELKIEPKLSKIAKFNFRIQKVCLKHQKSF